MKRPAALGDEDRLERDALLLAEARHAGVVALLDSGTDEQGPWLRLEDAGGVTVETILAGGGDDETLLALLASVATTVADLHDIGVVHGAIDASHVLVDRKGHPILCSFGRGGHLSDTDPRIDTAAVAHLVETALGNDLPPELTQVMESAQDLGAGRGPTARDVADALDAARRGSRVWPGTSARVLRPRTASRRTTWTTWTTSRSLPSPAPVVAAVAVIGGVLVAVAVFVLASGPGARPRDSAQHRPARLAPTSPRDAAGAATLTFTYDAGVLSFSGQRFAIGEPGDRVAIGRWSCGDPEIALLRLDGTIYLFDHLARAGLDQEGRPVARAPGATWLRSQPDAKPGCDLLVVGDLRGSAIVRPVAA